MRSILAAGAAAALLVSMSAAANANIVYRDDARVAEITSASTFDLTSQVLHPQFYGGCGFVTVNQPTTTGQSWVGIAYIAVASTDGVSSVGPVECEFFINGVSQGTILNASRGSGATANTGRFEFSASDTDQTMVCVHVAGIGSRCGLGEVTRVPPQILTDTVMSGVDVVNDAVVSRLDETICLGLILVSGPVNGLGHPELLYIDPFEGDVALAETPTWDCPPYDPV